MAVEWIRLKVDRLKVGRLGKRMTKAPTLVNCGFWGEKAKIKLASGLCVER